MEATWSTKQFIQSDAPLFTVWTFETEGKDSTINLGVWFSNYQDSMIFALYCPFWMINKTGLNLCYKVNTTLFPRPQKKSLKAHS